jgi:hypothetical protein
MLFAALQWVALGTPRRFAAVRRFGRDRSEADMRERRKRVDLTKMTHTGHKPGGNPAAQQSSTCVILSVGSTGGTGQ